MPQDLQSRCDQIDDRQDALVGRQATKGLGVFVDDIALARETKDVHDLTRIYHRHVTFRVTRIGSACPSRTRSPYRMAPCLRRNVPSNSLNSSGFSIIKKCPTPAIS